MLPVGRSEYVLQRALGKTVIKFVGGDSVNVLFSHEVPVAYK